MPAENGETEQLRCSSEKDITASAHKSPDKQCHCTHPGLDAALGTRASSQLIDRWAGAEASLTPPNVWFWGIAELKHLPNFQTFFPKGSNQTRNHLTVLTARIISPYAHRLSKCFLLACPASSLYARSTTRALLSSCVVIDLHEDGFVGSVQIIPQISATQTEDLHFSIFQRTSRYTCKSSHSYFLNDVLKLMITTLFFSPSPEGFWWHVN